MTRGIKNNPDTKIMDGADRQQDKRAVRQIDNRTGLPSPISCPDGGSLDCITATPGPLIQAPSGPPSTQTPTRPQTNKHITLLETTQSTLTSVLMIYIYIYIYI